MVAVLSLALTLLILGVKVFALIDCAVRKPVSFQLADTLPKNGWLVILGLGLAAHVGNWLDGSFLIGILSFAGTLAALVYLAQVRGRSF